MGAREPGESQARTGWATPGQTRARLPVDPSITFTPERTHISGRRLLAHLADGVLIGFVSLVLLVPGALISDVALLVAILATWLVLPFAYFVTTQRSGGRSPGKRMLGLRVVDRRGEMPATGALVRRSLPLPFEFTYLPALMSMMSSHYRQRLGDRWGDTYVIIDAPPPEDSHAP